MAGNALGKLRLDSLPRELCEGGTELSLPGQGWRCQAICQAEFTPGAGVPAAVHSDRLRFQLC